MKRLEGHLQSANGRFAVVASRFNQEVVDRLVEGALRGLREHGVADDAIDMAWVPGALEIPLVAKRLAESGDYVAVITLGAVIRGETDHYDHVCQQSAAGIARVALDTGVPIIFGVLTCQTEELALARAGGEEGNKGYDAAAAAIEMANLMQVLAEHARPADADETDPPSDNGGSSRCSNPFRESDNPSHRSHVSRRRAREVVLQLLYEADLNPDASKRPAEEFIDRRLDDPELASFARDLYSGIRSHRKEIDRHVSQAAENWSLDRMAPVDRNILRLATFELLHKETPVAVVIDEAVEMAKRFGSAESPAFVNGILDRIASRHQRPSRS